MIVSNVVRFYNRNELTGTGQTKKARVLSWTQTVWFADWRWGPAGRKRPGFCSCHRRYAWLEFDGGTGQTKKARVLSLSQTSWLVQIWLVDRLLIDMEINLGRVTIGNRGWGRRIRWIFGALSALGFRKVGPSHLAAKITVWKTITILKWYMAPNPDNQLFPYDFSGTFTWCEALSFREGFKESRGSGTNIWAKGTFSEFHHIKKAWPGMGRAYFVQSFFRWSF